MHLRALYEGGEVSLKWIRGSSLGRATVGYNYYFAIFLLTILITRGLLFVFPVASPTILQLRLHHWMYGLFLVGISFFISNVFVYAIGLGLVIDELTYIVMDGKTHQDNYSAMSVFGTIALIAVVYIFRQQVFGSF